MEPTIGTIPPTAAEHEVWPPQPIRHPGENYIVAATVLGALVAAWIHIQSEGIWYDEAITLLTTSGHAIPDWSQGMQQFKPTGNLIKILSDLYHYDVHPPLYFWILALWRLLLGSSLEVARWLSAGFTAAALIALYRYASRLGARWPCIPVMIYAVSAVGLRYAYNARPYAMAAYLVVLTLILADRKSRWTGVCAAACVATHYFTALCVGPILVIECARNWKTHRRWATGTLASSAIVCAPLLILLAKHVEARPHQYPGFGPARKEISTLLRAALEGGMPHSSMGLTWKFALLLAGGLALAGAIWAIRRKLFTLPLAYSLFLCSFLLTAILTHKSIMKMPNDYYLGVSAPLLILLIWFGLNAVPVAIPFFAIALITGSLTATPIMAYSDYRKMLADIRSDCDHCAIVVGYGYGGAVPACILYEAKGLDVYLLKSKDTVEDIHDRIGASRIIYLVPSNDPPTTSIEGEFVQAYGGIAEEGYFKIQSNRYIK